MILNNRGEELEIRLHVKVEGFHYVLFVSFTSVSAAGRRDTSLECVRSEPTPVPLLRQWPVPTPPALGVSATGEVEGGRETQTEDACEVESSRDGSTHQNTETGEEQMVVGEDCVEETGEQKEGGASEGQVSDMGETGERRILWCV